MDRVLTMVLDRDIYGEDVFERVIQDPYLHLITWQKGVVAEPWGPTRVTLKTVITQLNRLPMIPSHERCSTGDWLHSNA